MKHCRMMLYSGYISDEQLISAVRNSDSLDNCYIGFYEKTWSHREHKNINHELLKNISNYAKNAKVVHMTSKDLDVSGLENPKDMEIRCRNHLLKIARDENNDFLFLQDTDEFMKEEDYEFIKKNYIPEMTSAGFNCCAIRWITFWKNWNYAIVNEHGDSFQKTDDFLKSGYPLGWKHFILNLNTPIFFSDWKKFGEIEHSIKSWILYDIFMYHGSWILTNEQVLEKIKTWGHSNEASEEEWKNWYEEKWLKWSPEMEEISMKDKRLPVWKKATKYEGILPKECI